MPLKDTKDKKISNSEYKVQSWNVGAELKNFTLDNRKLTEVMIVNFVYTATKGPYYSINARLSEKSTIHFTLNHIEMLKYFEPAIDKQIDLSSYTIFLFPRFITSSEIRNITFKRISNSFRFYWNRNCLAKEAKFKEEDIELTAAIHDGENNDYCFNYIPVKHLMQNIYNARTLICLDIYDVRIDNRKYIKYELHKIKKNKQAQKDLKLLNYPDSLYDRMVSVKKEIEEDIKKSKKVIENKRDEIDKYNKLRKRIFNVYDDVEKKGFFIKYNINKVSENKIKELYQYVR